MERTQSTPVVALPSVTPTTNTSTITVDQSKSRGYLLFLQTLAGAGSGCVAKTATAPLERIKIIFQVQVC